MLLEETPPMPHALLRYVLNELIGVIATLLNTNFFEFCLRNTRRFVELITCLPHRYRRRTLRPYSHPKFALQNLVLVDLGFDYC